MKLIKQHTNSAFTIVELLVVIVVIGILAAISIVAYTAVRQRAISASLQSDLSTASKRIKLFQIENSAYPESLIDCPTPDVKNLCIKLSSGNSYVGYAFNNSSNPQTYSLIAGNGNVYYKVTSSTALAKLNPPTQPGVTPGAILELHAAKANNGNGPGINSPLTTTWKDTSGNGNNGTLTGFGGETPWAGAGTPSDPYRLAFNGVDEEVPRYIEGLDAHAATAEVWVQFDTNSYPNSAPTKLGYATIFSDIGYSGVIAAQTWSSDWQQIRTIYSPAIADGFPHHLVMTLGAQYMKLYCDGEFIGQADILTDFPMPPLGEVGLGRTGWGYWEGATALARVYPFVLSAAQVTTNYSKGPSW